MSWREVHLTLIGIKQREEPFRKLGQILIDLVVKERPLLERNGWSLPMDPGEDEYMDALQQQSKKMNEYKAQLLEKLKQKQQNGSN